MNAKNLFGVLGWGKRRVPIRKSLRKNSRLRFERLEDRTLLTADLIAFRPVTEFIDYSKFPVSEAVEEDVKTGPGIRVNGDDDNANGQPDYLDKGPSATADNDLVRVDAKGSAGTYTLSWPTTLAVWTTPTKQAPVGPATGASIQPNQSVWVEYVNPTVHTTSAKMTLTVSGADGTTTDSVVFHSFQSVVIAIGGRTQDPRKFGDPNLGTFTMGGTLYQKGYDVHLYAENMVKSTGSGAAYDEVVSAVSKRNVDYVAIFGYSWGGGATYELSVGLKNNTAIAGQYQLQYTAYVDGIRHNLLSAERRLPVEHQVPRQLLSTQGLAPEGR